VALLHERFVSCSAKRHKSHDSGPSRSSQQSGVPSTIASSSFIHGTKQTDGRAPPLSFTTSSRSKLSAASMQHAFSAAAPLQTIPHEKAQQSLYNISDPQSETAAMEEEENKLPTDALGAAVAIEPEAQNSDAEQQVAETQQRTQLPTPSRQSQIHHPVVDRLPTSAGSEALQPVGQGAEMRETAGAPIVLANVVRMKHAQGRRKARIEQMITWTFFFLFFYFFFFFFSDDCFGTSCHVGKNCRSKRAVGGAAGKKRERERQKED
jgi:hypothetical protein